MSGERGKFISIEGPDGSGKSTLIKSLVELLEQSGFEVVSTREPGGTPLAEEVRRILLAPDSGDVTPKAEMLLYAAARAQHVTQVIEPAIAAGKIVISDRFTDSSVAYQGYGRGLSKEFITATNRLAAADVFPDLTIVLDIDPVEGLKRISGGRNNLDRLESENMDFHRRVREGFLQQAEAEPERVKVIPAMDKQQVLGIAWELVRELLQLKPRRQE